MSQPHTPPPDIFGQTIAKQLTGAARPDGALRSDELAALREEIARLRERVAVLEAHRWMHAPLGPRPVPDFPAYPIQPHIWC